ncbi:MAG: ATP synthase F1 subunit gamma, partial [Balneolaceae bacterium]
MANLRDIRNRISSINNTQQITRAMKMVAAAKLRKAQDKIIQTRPYANSLTAIVAKLAANAAGEQQLLREPETDERYLFLVIGSDKGLCGAFNNNLFKDVETHLKNRFAVFLKEGNIDIITIGRKADAYFKKRKYRVVESHPGFFDDLNFESTKEIVQKATGSFVNGTYDGVFIAYNEFKTVITQNRIIEKILPIDPKLLSDEEDEVNRHIDYIYEPDANSILGDILPKHLNIQVWKAVLESNASEQGARMAAMD